MNIVLADMPKKEQDYNLTYPSLAITYLIGFAREYFGQDKHSFHYLEGNCSLKEHLATLEKLKPHVYGTTITAPVSELAYATICAVHEKFPNVKIICGKCGDPVRTGWKFLKDDKKVRYCKKCKEVIDK